MHIPMTVWQSSPGYHSILTIKISLRSRQKKSQSLCAKMRPNFVFILADDWCVLFEEEGGERGRKGVDALLPTCPPRSPCMCTPQEPLTRPVFNAIPGVGATWGRTVRMGSTASRAQTRAHPRSTLSRGMARSSRTSTRGSHFARHPAPASCLDAVGHWLFISRAAAPPFPQHLLLTRISPSSALRSRGSLCQHELECRH